jgi:hypothetical protein
LEQFLAVNLEAWNLPVEEETFTFLLLEFILRQSDVFEVLLRVVEKDSDGLSTSHTIEIVQLWF